MDTDRIIKGIKTYAAQAGEYLQDEQDDILRRLAAIDAAPAGSYVDDLRQLLYYAAYRADIVAAYEG